MQTVVAIVVVAAFAIGEIGWNPENGPYAVLTLFTWLTNTGAFGLVLLMVLVSIAVIGFSAATGGESASEADWSPRSSPPSRSAGWRCSSWSTSMCCSGRPSRMR